MQEHPDLATLWFTLQSRDVLAERDALAVRLAAFCYLAELLRSGNHVPHGDLLDGNELLKMTREMFPIGGASSFRNLTGVVKADAHGKLRAEERNTERDCAGRLV